MTSKNSMSKKIKKSKAAPVNFKLKLITEVQKHDIIWQNIKEKKNGDLLEDAWKRVQKALLIREGYCKKQWNLVLNSYRPHLSVGKPMNADLSKAMAFMKPQLKKSPTDLNENDAMDCELNKRKKKLPKDTQGEEAASARAVSLAIVNLLFDSLPADATTQVCDALLGELLKLRPNLKTDILEHGRKQTDILNPDWSGLAIPGELCQEIYKQMLQDILQKSSLAGSEKH